MNDLFPRILSGVIFVAAIVCGVWFHELAYAAVFIIIGIISLFEFQNITSLISGFNIYNKLFLFVSFLIMFSITFCVASKIVPPVHLSWIGGLILIPFLMELFSKDPSLPRAAIMLLMITYVATPLCLSNFIVFSPHDSGISSYNGQNLLAIIFLTWTLDVFAYLTGSLIGKNPLFKRISPKKSVEGLVGGAVICIGSIFIYSRILNTDLNISEWLFLSIIVIVFGTFGDLVESMIKRELNIKDSGKIMPGHGGFLDRFDALFFILPFAAIYMIIFT